VKLNEYSFSVIDIFLACAIDEQLKFQVYRQFDNCNADITKGFKSVIPNRGPFTMVPLRKKGVKGAPPTWCVFQYPVAFGMGQTREHFAESSYTTQLRVQTMHNTRIVLPVASTIARAEIWRDRPCLNRTHLVFDEVVPMGRQQATRPGSDEDCIRIERISLLQSLCRALGQTEASSNLIFKVLARPGRDSNHANNGLPDMKRAL